jgi:hypothetical protein
MNDVGILLCPATHCLLTKGTQCEVDERGAMLGDGGSP